MLNGLGRYKWVGSRLSTIKIVKLHRNLHLQSVFHSLFYGLRPADSIVSPFIHFPRSHEKYCHYKILIDNLTINQLLEALTLLWHLGINGVMEIVDEEDWEGIILVQGMPDRNNNKGYVCCCHHGFMTWH